MPNAPTDPADPHERLKIKAVEFVMALASPEVLDPVAAWHGMAAVLELLAVSNANPDALKVAFARLKRVAGVS
jgi:hypothetical protein